MMTEDLIHAMEAHGIHVVDVRGQLAAHPYKTFDQRDPDRIRGLCVHHSAGEGSGWMALIGTANYHVGANHVCQSGAPGLLYTMAVDHSGTVYICHDLEAKTWSQGSRAIPGDENRDYLALLVQGNFDGPSNRTGREPTWEQVLAVLLVWRACRGYWDSWDDRDLMGHFDFGKPACPGATLEAVIRACRANAAVEVSGYDLGTTHGRQRAMASLGFDPGPVDGVWGPRSRAALVAMQLSLDLSTDGVWGPLTGAAAAAALNDL